MDAIDATVELDGQYRALREQAAFVDRSNRGMLLVSGAEAAELLQGQLTNEIEGLAPGQGCYAALLDRKGRMQADMRVLRLGAGEVWLDTEPDAVAAVARHLNMYRVGREVEVGDIGGRRALISVIGPAAAELAQTGPLGAEHAHREIDPPTGSSCRAVATDRGVDLIADETDAEALRVRLAAAGVVEVGEEAAEIIRVEAGRPRFGREMTTTTIPEEAGINERAVSFTKGCYIGQETVARLHYKGKPNRRLRGLRLESPSVDGEPVRLGERELGTLGTVVVSPVHGPIALAILRREAEPGAEVVVGDAVKALVAELPFRG